MGEAFAKFIERVMVWNREVFGNIFQRKKRVLARLRGIQKALETHSTCRLRALELELREELENILFQEEVYWKAKVY